MATIMFVNNNTHPQQIIMSFPCTQYLKHPSRYVTETLQKPLGTSITFTQVISEACSEALQAIRHGKLMGFKEL